MVPSYSHCQLSRRHEGNAYVLVQYGGLYGDTAADGKNPEIRMSPKKTVSLVVTFLCG